MEASEERMESIFQDQLDFFRSGKTGAYSFRRDQLLVLKKAIGEYEQKILTALKTDMRKSRFEAYFSEIDFVVREINYFLKYLKVWMRPRRVRTPLFHFPSRGYIYPEPLGRTLIIAPWNYPFQLLIAPLIGAIAGGNTAILKPSEYAPATAGVVEEMIHVFFKPYFIKVIQGAVETNQFLLKKDFDLIFFTGSAKVGKIVMKAAAQNLTPVVLELGGKSPCIVDSSADVQTAARRIVWGKFFNAGQTCIAPDYVLADRVVKKELIEQMGKALREFYGKDPSRSFDYARIINEQHFDRLIELLHYGDVAHGGDYRKEELYISPTIVDNVEWEGPLMEEEIFGPILPVLEYGNLDEAIYMIHKLPKPLALYFFSNRKKNQHKIVRQTSSGGVCINDTLSHITLEELPFGGVGDSGMGDYHGKATFDAFTHRKSVLKKSLWIDPKMKYPPYPEKFNWMKRFFKWFG
jgi:acyl-CoA reductase-like NAD-dependent aldehyde dehydrogenase